MKMPGLNRKVRIATDWLLHALFPPELAQTKVAFGPGIRKQHFEPGDIIFQQGDLGVTFMSLSKASARLFVSTTASKNSWLV